MPACAAAITTGKMLVIVTGAAGFVGSHLAVALAQRGHRVVGLDAFNAFYDPALKQENARAAEAAGVAMRRLDLVADELGGALEGAAAVYHLAAQPGLSERTTFDDYVRNNVTATGRLLEAAERAGVPRFLHVSTSSIYGREATGDETTLPAPTSVYGVTKLAAEQLVMARHREGALAASVLRIFSVYGPRERPDKFYARLIGALLQDQEIPLFEGSEAHTRSYSYVGDIVAGLIAALDRWEAARGEIYNIGSDVETTTGEGLAIVERLTGRSARLKRVPKRAGDQLRTHADIGKARRLLGYAPATSLEEGLGVEIEWFRARLGERR